jgi:hypothetical protein
MAFCPIGAFGINQLGCYDYLKQQCKTADSGTLFYQTLYHKKSASPGALPD